MKISPDELQKAALEFGKASDDTDEIIQRLELAMKNLEMSWDGADQQLFYKYFQEWHTYIASVSQLESLIALELNAIAAKYLEADSSSITSSNN